VHNRKVTAWILVYALIGRSIARRRSQYWSNYATNPLEQYKVVEYARRGLLEVNCQFEA
jgi:hypothetical protein